MLKNYFLAGAVILSIFGCTSDSTQDLIEPLPIDTNVTYNDNVKTIIDNSCLGCHGVFVANGAPMSLNSYQKVKDAMLSRGLLDRIFRENGQGGLMPQGGPRLPQNAIDIITQWQSNNLPE